MSAMQGPVLLGQLSDTHVVGSETTTRVFADNNERLRHAVASIRQEEPPLDAVLVTGDLVEDGRPSEYAELAALLDPIDAPVLVIPGNHDDRDLVRSTFPDIEWSSDEHLSWVHEISGVRIIGLDSIRPGRPGGEFDEVRAAWLSSVLDQPHDGPTLLAIHHPPFASGIEWMDRSGLVGIDRFREVIGGSVVDRILCGHLHRPMTSVVAGVVAQVGISTVQHVALDLEAGAPMSLVRDPVGYQIHRVVGREIVTHVRYFETGAEPFSPPWSDDA